MRPAAALRGLKAILWLMALDSGIKSLLLLFTGRSLTVRLFPHPPVSEVSDLLLLKQKEWGALSVALTLMLISAARQPLERSAIIWPIAVGLIVAGLVDFFGIWVLGSEKLYPVSMTMGHAVIRFVFATLLLYFLMRAGRKVGGYEPATEPRMNTEQRGE